MSLLGALNVGSNALTVSQTALQVTANNIANASDPNYTRQVVNLTPAGEQEIQQGIFVGEGVTLQGVQRQIDDSLTTRLNNATSDNSAANVTQQYMGQVESSINALGSQNLQTQLNTFFGDWSTLANNPQDAGQRQVVLQDGENTADAFTTLRSQLTSIQQNINGNLTTDVQQANNLASQIAQLNGQIVAAQDGSVGSANALQDQRNAAVKQLSQLADVNTVSQSDGTVDVYIGSEQLVNGTNSRALALQQTTTANATTGAGGAATGTTTTPQIVFADNKGGAPIISGEIGGLLSTTGQVQGVVTQLDTQANALIFELNKIHASGQGTSGLTTVTSTNAVTDPTAALNNAGLANAPTNGSFVVHVTNAAGLTTSTLIKVSLTGNPATDTTLNSIAASLSAVTGVTATVNGGKLSIAAAAGDQISFSQDSSGTLAALGVNTFFTGSNAANIAVNPTLTANPSLIAAAKNGDPSDNQTALAIANLQTQSLTSLNGQSLTGAYQGMVTGVATAVSSATSNATASNAVVSTLQSQHDALSGVSLDEETVNLIQQQTAYQAAARVITTVNNMITTLLAITTVTT